jgi:hypothetical protein
MGNAKVLTLTTSMRRDTIKIDGPGLIVFRVYDKLLRANGKIKTGGNK